MSHLDCGRDVSAEVGVSLLCELTMNNVCWAHNEHCAAGSQAMHSRGLLKQEVTREPGDETAHPAPWANRNCCCRVGCACWRVCPGDLSWEGGAGHRPDKCGPREMDRKVNTILINRDFWGLLCKSAQTALSPTPWQKIVTYLWRQQACCHELQQFKKLTFAIGSW